MNVLDIMRELAEKRAERFTPYPLAKFFPVTDLKTMTWIGTFSWANQAAHARWLSAGVVVDLFGVPQIPPEIARDYLRAKYTAWRPHTEAQFASINEHRAAPLYAKIGQYADMAYVDLKAAYWSIIQVVGWDVDYHPGRWLGKRSDMHDFPLPDNKLARNSLVSTGLITRQNIWTGEHLKSIKAHNPLVNYDVWALAQDVLHAIAQVALKAGAVHIHTDGYIVPMRMAIPLIEQVRKWGLQAIVKQEGDCKIYGIGSYDIGDKHTLHRYHYRPSNLNKLYEPDIKWLMPRFAKFAKTRIQWDTIPGEGGYTEHEL